jgi:hypothetical protein
MTRQNATILQSFLLQTSGKHKVINYLMIKLGYEDMPSAVGKLNEIVEDLQGDIDAGRGKEADESIEEFGGMRPKVEAPGDGADDEGSREEFLKRWRDLSGEDEVT